MTNSTPSRRGLRAVFLGAIGVVVVAALILFLLEIISPTGSVTELDRFRRQAEISALVINAADHPNAFHAAGGVLGLGFGIATGSTLVYRRKRI